MAKAEGIEYRKLTEKEEAYVRRLLMRCTHTQLCLYLGFPDSTISHVIGPKAQGMRVDWIKKLMDCKIEELPRKAKRPKPKSESKVGLSVTPTNKTRHWY